MTASPRHELRQRVRWPALGLALAMAYGVAVRHAGGQIAPNPPSKLQLRQGDLVLLLGEEELAAVRGSAAAPQD